MLMQFCRGGFTKKSLMDHPLTKPSDYGDEADFTGEPFWGGGGQTYVH